MTTNSHKMGAKAFAVLALGALLAWGDVAESTNAPAGQSTDLKQLLNENKREQGTANSRFFEEKAGFSGDSGLMDNDASKDDDERDFRSGKRVVGFEGTNSSANLDEGAEEFTKERVKIVRQNEGKGVQLPNPNENLALRGFAPQSLGQIFAPNASKINALEMNAANASTLADAIRRERGVFFRDAIGGDAVSNAYMRGFGRQQNTLYIDGIAFMDFDMGRNDYEMISTKGISQVQLITGYISPSHAQGFGGVNLVSHTPQKVLEASFGIERDFNAVGRNGTTTQKHLYVGTRGDNYYLSASYSDYDRDAFAFSQDNDEGYYLDMQGYQINSRLENTSVKLRAGWFNDSNEYSVNYYYQKGSRDGMVVDNDVREYASYGYDYPLDRWGILQKQMIYVLGKSNFTQKLSLDSKIYYQSFDSQYTQTFFARGYSQNEYGPINEYNDDAYGLMAALNYAFLPTQNVKFGFHLKRDAYKNYKSRVDRAYSKTPQTDLAELKSSVFGEYGGKFGDFSLILGASYERADILKARNSSLYNTYNTSQLQSTISQTSTEKINHKGDFTAQLAMLYDFNEANKAHLSVGKKLNYSTLHQRYPYVAYGMRGAYANNIEYILYEFNYAINKSLRPESVISYELGYDLTLPSTAVSVVGFYNDLYDGFMLRQVGTSSKTVSTYTANFPVYMLDNGYKGYNYGGEVSFEQGFFAGNALVVGANYSYIYSKQRADDKAAPEFRHHNHIVNAKISLTPIKAANISVLGTYQSAPVVNSLTQWLRGRDYVSVDIMASFYVAKGFTLKAGVMNVSDRDNVIRYEGAKPYNTIKDTETLSNGGIYEYHLAGRRYMIGFDYNYQK